MADDIAPAAPAAFEPTACEEAKAEGGGAREPAPTRKGAAAAEGEDHHQIAAKRSSLLKAPFKGGLSLDAMLGDGFEDAPSAAELAIQAVEAARQASGEGGMTPSKLGSLGSLSSLKLSDSFGYTKSCDAFLERLSKAESVPCSPNPMLLSKTGGGGAPKPLGRSLMPTSPMAMAH